MKKPPYILSRINDQVRIIKVKIIFQQWTKLIPKSLSHELVLEGLGKQSTYEFEISKMLFMRKMLKPY
jgi:hypothetical protein